jgi:hypothetical protein
MNALQSNDFNQTVSTKTTSYTLVAADAGTKIVMNSASATTITVNTSLFAAGDTLTILNIAAGVCTVTAGTATVSTASTLALVQNAGGTLYFTSAGVSVFQADGVTAAAGGKLLQVVSTAKTDTYSQSVSLTYTDVTGLSVAITPTLATSKVYVSVLLHTANDTASGERGMFRIMRDSTAIGIGDAAGSRTRATTGYFSLTNTQTMNMYGMNFLDSPATTSATTYKIQMFNTSGAVQYVNRTSDNADASYTGRVISTITVMEIGV